MMRCKKKIVIKQFAKPVKETLPVRIKKTLPKKGISFPKPARKPVIKPVC